MCLREIVISEAHEFEQLLELMRGHWDSLEADEELLALELALSEEPRSELIGYTS
jgi:hypothetical protein